MSRILYLDLDGVLANFDREIWRIFGKNFRDLGDAETRWALITSECPDIYARLSPMDDADDLVAGVSELCVKHNVVPGILTALPKYGRLPAAERHKYEWVRTRWPILLRNFNVAEQAINKQYMAKPGDVLIDDSPLNIPQWNSMGGYGILHTSAAESLTQLRQYLEVSDDAT